MTNVIEVLKERGFIDAVTSDELITLSKLPLKVYCGFDPSAKSLHLGNMVAIMGLAWFQKFGHTPVAIVGGATGMIGDPSGKNQERNLLDEKTIEENLAGIKKNLDQILSQKEPKAVLLNNYDWFKSFSFISFLRDVGKHFRLGPMLAKDSVKNRFQTEEGMSFTEFSYQLLQAYDFLYLFEHHGVTVQLGGSDQWGNITAGTDLIRKVAGKEAFGATFSLLTKADGQKFGKSEKGAIWLSEELLSPYEFYQYLVRVEDADVIKLLKMLTFLDMDQIRRIEKSMDASDYVPNSAQKVLAEEVTRIVHGEEGLKRALMATAHAKPGAETTLDEATLDALSREIPPLMALKKDIVGQKLVDVVAALNILPSKSEVRRWIKNGGLFLNNQKVTDDRPLNEEDVIAGKYLLIASGKKNKFLIQIQSS